MEERWGIHLELYADATEIFENDFFVQKSNLVF